MNHTLTGDVRFHPNFRSRLLPTDRNVIVYLPPGYEKRPNRRYSVLYLQDGQNIFDGATSFIPGQEWRVDETAERLIRTGRIEPLIIVGIYNAGVDRIDEYTPAVDPLRGRGGKAGLYARMLIEELKPFIDLQYRTLRGAFHTGLGGSSLGGLLTLNVGLAYPHVFGRLAVMSPSVWWNGGMIFNRIAALDSKLPLRIWLDMGSEESREGLQQARGLRDALAAKGWADDLRYFEAHGAGHNELAWAERVGPALEFLFPIR